MSEENPDKALHFSTGKAGVDQIPTEILMEWGQVFDYGAEKYFRDNWKRGNEWHEFVGSALRHLFAWQRGQNLDPESDLPHLAHALWNVGALLYYQKHSLGNDNRPVALSTEYAAGLFDGEGSVVVDKSTHEDRVRYSLRIQITNTDRAVLERVQERWSGNITTQDRTPNLPVHVWQTTGKKALAFLKEVVPFLHIKSLQAYRAIDFQENVIRPDNHSRNALTDLEIALREDAYRDLRILKKVEAYRGSKTTT